MAIFYDLFLFPRCAMSHHLLQYDILDFVVVHAPSNCILRCNKQFFSTCLLPEGVACHFHPYCFPPKVLSYARACNVKHTFPERFLAILSYKNKFSKFSSYAVRVWHPRYLKLEEFSLYLQILTSLLCTINTDVLTGHQSEQYVYHLQIGSVSDFTMFFSTMKRIFCIGWRCVVIDIINSCCCEYRASQMMWTHNLFLLKVFKDTVLNIIF